jgi:hypothetical protein
MLFFRPAPKIQVFPDPNTNTPHGRRAAKLAAKQQRKLKPVVTFVGVER